MLSASPRNPAPSQYLCADGPWAWLAGLSNSQARIDPDHDASTASESGLNPRSAHSYEARIDIDGRRDAVATAGSILENVLRNDRAAASIERRSAPAS